MELVKALLPQAFAWARSAHPTQPLTSGLWEGDWPSKKGPTPMEEIQLQNSDIITFHNYSWPEDFERRVTWLEKQGRPVICTEYMARSAGSTFDGVLPIAKKHHVGAINWGLVHRQDADDLIRGSRGAILTFSISRRCGFTTCSRRMGRRTGSKRWC